MADIAENPKRLRIVELEAAQVPRALDDVDAAAINTDYAIIAGLNPVRDSLARESGESPYANLIVVRQSGEKTVWHRLCREFVNDLRRQLLIWRSLEGEEKKRFEPALQGRIFPVSEVSR